MVGEYGRLRRFAEREIALNEYQSGSTPLLGVGGSSGPINSFRGWQYFLIFFVLALGSIYAAPNLFQPDPALEVRAVSSSSMDAEVLSRLWRIYVRVGKSPASKK